MVLRCYKKLLVLFQERDYVVDVVRQLSSCETYMSEWVFHVELHVWAELVSQPVRISRCRHAVELAHKDANGDVLDVANVHERRPLLAVVLQVALYAVVVLLKVVTAVVFADKLER